MTDNYNEEQTQGYEIFMRSYIDMVTHTFATFPLECNTICYTTDSSCLVGGFFKRTTIKGVS